MTSHPKRYAFQVTGDGHTGQPLGSQPFSLQPPEPGCQLPMAEKPTPELPMPVPVTRHLKMDVPIQLSGSPMLPPVSSVSLAPVSTCQLAS
jgi:hypothetical protein